MEPLFGLIAAAIAASVAYLVTSERRRAQLAGLAPRGDEERALGRGGGGGGDLRGGVACPAAPGTCGFVSRGTGAASTSAGRRSSSPASATARAGCRCAARASGPRSRSASSARGRSRSATPSFDDEYYVQGQAPLALAILEPETRRRLAGLLRGQVAVEGREPVDVDATLADGVLEVRVKESGFSGSREHVPAILAEALDVARLLVAPKDVAARIAANVRRGARGGRAAAGRADARPRVPAAPGDARGAPRGARGRERGGAPARGDGARRGGAGDAPRSRRRGPGPTTRARRGRSRRSGSGCRRSRRRRRCAARSGGRGAP